MNFFWVPLLLMLPLVVFLQLPPLLESAPIGENALELIGRHKRAEAGDKEVRRIRKYRSKGKNENGKRWEREHSLEEHEDRHGRTLRKRKRQRDEDEEFSEEEHEHHHERKLPRNTDDSHKKGMSNSKLFGKIAKYGLTAASAFTLGRANGVMQNQQPFFPQPFMPPAAPIVPFPMVPQPAPIIQPFGFGLQCNGIFCY